MPALKTNVKDNATVSFIKDNATVSFKIRFQKLKAKSGVLETYHTKYFGETLLFLIQKNPLPDFRPLKFVSRESTVDTG